MPDRPILCLILALIAAGTPLQAEWGGSISQSLSETRQDTTSSRSLDQQYYLYTTARPGPALRYTLSSGFRHVQANVGDGPFDWRTEVNPAGLFQLTTVPFTLRGDAAYRTDQDESGQIDIVGQSALLHAQSADIPKWPRAFASASWSKNVNNLDLIGLGTRSTALAAGSSYYTRLLNAAYEFSNTRVRNSASNIDRLTQTHSARADQATSFAKGRFGYSANYRVDSRTEKDLSDAIAPSLIHIPASGLYLADPSPEFDRLEPAYGLTDGQLDIPASSQYNLVNGEYHSFGLDFIVRTSVDHIHLFLDSLSVGAPLWSIWVSEDNLNWTSIAQNIAGEFSPVFYRYEFAFDSVTTRYIKLAATPQLLTTPVYVSELRGLITSAAETQDRATDHRASGRVYLRPATWLHGEVGGDLLRQDLSQTALAREEDGLSSTLRFVPTALFDLSARYQWGRRSYERENRDEGTNASIGAVLRSDWSRALTTQATLDRREENSDSLLARRSETARLDLNLVIFPALRSSTQLSYTQDERFDSPDRIFSRSIAQSFDGEPTSRSQIGVGYRYETHSADVAAVLKYRTAVDIRASYRLTETVMISASGSASEDPRRNDRLYNALLFWNPTHKLNCTAAYNRIEGNLAQNEDQYSAQATFRWTVRTEISASYSLNDLEGGETITSSRLTMVARF